MNKQDEEDYNFTDSSTVNNNLDNCVKKHKKDNLTSPVFIQSYGNNNFIIESINDIQNKTNDRYDMYCSYDESNFKNNKDYKSNKTSIIISPKKNNTFFNSKKIKPVLNNYKDYANTEMGYDYVDNNFILNNYDNNKDGNKKIKYDTLCSYQGYTKEDVDDLFYPSEKSDLITKKRPHLIKHQKSSTAFISKNKLKKKIKKNNIILNNKNYEINDDIYKNIKTEFTEEKKKPSLSTSKNQLNEFNIDKLIEIGDNFALKCFNKMYKQNKLPNGINKNDDDISEKKDKQNNLINKMMYIEEKRKNTILKSNRSNITSRINSIVNINDLDNNRENENKTEIKDINDTYNYNYEPNNKNKVIKINNLTRENQINNRSKINLKKIKKDSIIIPNKYKIKTFNSFKEFKRNHINLGNLTNKNILINKDMKLFKNQINNKIINKKILDIPKDVNYKTINSNNVIQNKILYNNYLKNKVNNKNDKKQSIPNNYEKVKKGNNHHSFLERVNVNQNKRVIKIHNSFNKNNV
jgi:hypothetical protein